MAINNPKGILLMTIGMALFAFADNTALSIFYACRNPN